MIRAQTPYDFVLRISIFGVVSLSSSLSKICNVVVYCRFFIYWSIWTRAVNMEYGKKQNSLDVLRPGHVRNFHFYSTYEFSRCGDETVAM